MVCSINVELITFACVPIYPSVYLSTRLCRGAGSQPHRAAAAGGERHELVGNGGRALAPGADQEDEETKWNDHQAGRNPRGM